MRWRDRGHDGHSGRVIGRVRRNRPQIASHGFASGGALCRAGGNKGSPRRELVRYGHLCDLRRPVIGDDEVNHPIVVKVAGTIWTRVDDISVSGSTDEVYEFNATTGVVTFGDGINGKIPPSSNTIELTYGPKDVQHGDDVEQSLWFGVQSLGIVGNPITVLLEAQISTSISIVNTAHQNILSVSGVFLETDPNRLGINFFATGSFDGLSGEITLGTALPNATTRVLIDYTYQILDDVEPTVTQIGEGITHTFDNAIPSNNAKKLFLSLTPPASASPSGVLDIQFKIKLTFDA